LFFEEEKNKNWSIAKGIYGEYFRDLCARNEQADVLLF
jgi:hypothetical protein